MTPPFYHYLLGLKLLWMVSHVQLNLSTSIASLAFLVFSFLPNTIQSGDVHPMGEAKRRTHTTLLVCLKPSGLKPSTVSCRCEGTASQRSPYLDRWRSSWSAGAS